MRRKGAKERQGRRQEERMATARARCQYCPAFPRPANRKNVLLRFCRGRGIFPVVKRGRKPNPPVPAEPDALVCTGIVRQARAHLDKLTSSSSSAAVPPEHGNTRLRA